MTNTYFRRQPLEKAIDTIVSGSKRFKFDVTYHEDFIAEDPNFNKKEVLYTSNDKSEVLRQLRKAIEYSKKYNDKCKNEDEPKFENLIEEPSNSYTYFIRYQ